MGEVEAQLRGGLAMTQVTWLTSPELAVACRTGFAPADRASIVEALAAQATEPGVMPMCRGRWPGRLGRTRRCAMPVDAWNSVSSTIKLPAKGR